MSRSNQTKQLLAESLQDLMVTAPLEKISVNDIVEHAGVGRNTFYYHFEDKYDLVNWYFQNGATHFLVEHSRHGDWRSLLLGLEEYFRENKVFYRNALEYTGQNSLQEYIFTFLKEFFMQRLLEHSSSIDLDEANFATTFMAGACMGILMTWVRDDMKSNLQEHYSALIALHNGDLIKALLD